MMFKKLSTRAKSRVKIWLTTKTTRKPSSTKAAIASRTSLSQCLLELRSREIWLRFRSMEGTRPPQQRNEKTTRKTKTKKRERLRLCRLSKPTRTTPCMTISTTTLTMDSSMITRSSRMMALLSWAKEPQTSTPSFTEASMTPALFKDFKQSLQAANLGQMESCFQLLEKRQGKKPSKNSSSREKKRSKSASKRDSKFSLWTILKLPTCLEAKKSIGKMIPGAKKIKHFC